MRFLWLVGIALAFQSCGAQWHLKRAIAKDPDILADTIIKIDTTIVTESIRAVDTLIVTDTIVRESVREGVRIRVQRIHDTIRVDVVCPPDTIRMIKEVPVERVIYKEKAKGPSIWDQISKVLYLILAVVIASAVGRLIRRN